MPASLNSRERARLKARAHSLEPVVQVGHAGLTDAQSELLNARLVLLLANHVGDLAVLREALALARDGVAPHEVDSTIESTL